MRRLSFLILAGMLALGIGAIAPTGRQAAAEEACFQEVRYCAENAFLTFWQNNGNLRILGLPFSQPFVDDRGLIVQYYERAILEWHPNNPPEYQVELTLLGDQLVGNRPERSAPAIPCAGNCAYLEDTKHTLRGTFLEFWQARGGLAVFGFPLTEQFTEVSADDGQTYTVQYFQRNRFELHTESVDPEYRVQLGRLGKEALEKQRQLLDRPRAQVPNYTVPPVTPGLPVTLTIPAIGVNAPVEHVGLVGGNMDVPKNPYNTAWYNGGARPAQVGNAVIAGHVDHNPEGRVVFWDMIKLKAGDEVFVTDDKGNKWRFVVKSMEIFPADNAPLERVFGSTSAKNLNLISCTGDFDPSSRSYNNRIIAFTELTGLVK